MAGPKRSGIYAITNTLDGKRYIGSSVDIGRRFRHHRKDLSSDRHWNTYLQRAFNLHGSDAFLFEVLEEGIAEADLFQAEQRWVNSERTAERDYGYNLNMLCKRGLSSPEARARQAERQRGVKRPAHVMEALRVANLGRKRSDESRAKQGASLLGRRHSDTTRQRMRAAALLITKSEAHLENLRRSLRTESSRAKARAAKLKIDPASRILVRAMVDGGKPLRAIAESYGVHITTIRRIVREGGTPSVR